MKTSSPKVSSHLPYYKPLTWILLLSVVVLAIAAGYYQQLYLLENKRYKKIEDQFVRIRSQLGREKTNQLIESSYQNQAPRD